MSRLIQSTGIIFRSLKYSETSLILDIYTLDEGLMSCIISGVRTTRSKMGNAIFHPINIIDFTAYPGQEKRLHRIKEARLHHVYAEILIDVVKSSIAMFAIDLCRHAIREREKNSEMFSFLKDWLIRLDKTNEPVELSPHRFALQLTSYLGFEPTNNRGHDLPYFDLESGQFIAEIVPDKNVLHKTHSQIIAALMDDTRYNPMHKKDRQDLLDQLILYYRYHIEGFREPKSLAVLRAIMS